MVNPYVYPGLDPLQNILNACASEYGLTEEEIKSECRSRNLADCRMMICLLAYEYDENPSPIDIGRYINRKRCNVMDRACRGKERIGIKSYAEFNRKLQILRKKTEYLMLLKK